MSGLYKCPDCGGTSCVTRGCGSCSDCVEGYVHEPGCRVADGTYGICTACGQALKDDGPRDVWSIMLDVCDSCLSEMNPSGS